jgi:alpha-beta hydrolase superfamily lysophospholipase
MQAYLYAVESESSERRDVGLTDDSNTATDWRYEHRWKPKDTEPWAAVSILHGFGDHGGRFEGMATYLASLGLAVSAIDLVGHGKSPGRRGVIASYEQLLGEVDGALSLSRSDWPRIPHFLFGQSMGGNLAINWMLRGGQQSALIHGAIIGSPMLRTPCEPKAEFMRAGRWLAQKLPNLRIHTPMCVEKLSQDRRAQDAYRRDRLVHRAMSLRLATSLIDSGNWAMDNAHLLSIPTLLMHGTHDALTSCDASEEFARRAGPTAEFIAWEGCRHDLHDEPQREAVFSSVAFWAKNRCIQTETIGRIGLSKGSFPRSAVGRASDCRVCIEGNPQASYTADF